MSKILKIESVQEYNEFTKQETLHPMVSVIDLSSVKPMRHIRKNFGFYAVMLKDIECGELRYGRSFYDYQKGTLVFIAPGQVVGNDDDGSTFQAKGWALLFHPELLRGTALARKMTDYSFFSYEVNEALHMSEREREVILNSIHEIRTEIERPIDKHTKSIIVANIEVLLNHCVRFYDRQFLTRENENKNILTRFEEFLDTYFDSDKPYHHELPTVRLCAETLHLSANYFGDLIKKETGKSAQDYIQSKVIDRAKYLFTDSDRTVSEIAYELGFKYPNHLSRLFKSVSGMTPNEYRQLN